MNIGIIGLGLVGKAVYDGLKIKNILDNITFYDIKYPESKIEDILDSECVFVCVPTPVGDNDQCDLTILHDIIAQLDDNNYQGVIAIKSTITPNTTDNLIIQYPKLQIAFVPEFLRERSALNDFLNSKVCLIGTHKETIYLTIVKILKNVYKEFKYVNPIEAELTKYFQNVFNTNRILFANAFYEVCKVNKVNYNSIVKTLEQKDDLDIKYLLCDKNMRGPSGPCLVKDTLAFNQYVKDLRLSPAPKIFQTLVDDMCIYPKTVIEGTRSEKEYFGKTITKRRRILFTGSHGFIAGYTVPKLLENGHQVWGIDNFWKYGKLEREYDTHKNFTFIEGDATNKELLYKIVFENKIEIIIASAAIIGGISMFHELPYDIICQNEKITCASFDVAIEAYKAGFFEKIVVMSSSMVFERATVFPTPETHVNECPPPMSSYGLQKLTIEYFAKAAKDQYGLPYVIVRPFNAIGIGEKRAKVDKTILSGNVKLAMSHVLPDLIQKIYKGQNPLHILGDGNQIRHYTYAGDIADGIYECVVNPLAINNDFNISTNIGHSVIELAKIVWERLKPDESFNYVCDKPYEYDVQMRVPNIEKAKKILNLECKTSLSDTLDEVIPWIVEQIKLNNI